MSHFSCLHFWSELPKLWTMCKLFIWRSEMIGRIGRTPPQAMQSTSPNEGCIFLSWNTIAGTRVGPIGVISATYIFAKPIFLPRLIPIYLVLAGLQYPIEFRQDIFSLTKRQNKGNIVIWNLIKTIIYIYKNLNQLLLRHNINFNLHIAKVHPKTRHTIG